MDYCNLRVSQKTFLENYLKPEKMKTLMLRLLDL